MTKNGRVLREAIGRALPKSRKEARTVALEHACRLSFDLIWEPRSVFGRTSPTILSSSTIIGIY
jgi:hypothetical protein